MFGSGMFWLAYCAFVLAGVAMYSRDLSLLESVIVGTVSGAGAVFCTNYAEEIGEVIIVVTVLSAPVVIVSSFVTEAS